MQVVPMPMVNLLWGEKLTSKVISKKPAGSCLSDDPCEYLSPAPRCPLGHSAAVFDSWATIYTQTIPLDNHPRAPINQVVCQLEPCRDSLVRCPTVRRFSKIL